MTVRSEVVGKRIIERSEEFSSEVRRTFTPLKVLKLAYIAHGWRLALTAKDEGESIPLVEDKVKAWQYGPVMINLYEKIQMDYVGRVPVEIFDDIDDTLSDDEREVIDFVVDTYDSKSAYQLVGVVHKKGTPWHDVYHGKKSRFGISFSARNAEIPDSLTLEYYSKELERLLDDKHDTPTDQR